MSVHSFSKLDVIIDRFCWDCDFERNILYILWSGISKVPEGGSDAASVSTPVKL